MQLKHNILRVQDCFGYISLTITQTQAVQRSNSLQLMPSHFFLQFQIMSLVPHSQIGPFYEEI